MWRDRDTIFPGMASGGLSLPTWEIPRRRFLVAGRAMPIPLSTARGYLLHVHTLSNRLVRGGKSLSLELRGES
jgi:hypothetical protein